MGSNRCYAYSLLEITLVTTLLVIFMFVVNPGTYIDRFSQILVKMNILRQTELVANKFIHMGYLDCNKANLLDTKFSYVVNGALSSYIYSNNELIIQNQYNQDATLFRLIDFDSENGFSYYNRFFQNTVSISDAIIVDYFFSLSTYDYDLKGTLPCNSNKFVLNEY